MNTIIQPVKFAITSIIQWVLEKDSATLSFFIHSKFKDLRHGAILFYRDPERAEMFGYIGKMKKSVDFKLAYIEAYQIYRTVHNLSKVPGAVAEVGTFDGGSAHLIAKAKGDKTFHVFDTFEGLPEVSDKDSEHFFVGQYSSPLERVKKNVGDFEGVQYHVGIFPEDTGDTVKGETFSFAHLDVDTYVSTLNCLKFFYPRMARGGVIISHDYISADGVRSAFDEFFADKSEIILETSGSQALVVKL